MSYFLRETGEYGEMGTYWFAKVLCKSRDLCGNFCKAKSPTYYAVCIYALTGFSVPSLPNTQGALVQAVKDRPDHAVLGNMAYTVFGELIDNMDQRAHLRRNIRLQVTLFSTISCMAMEKRANVTDLILTVL